MQEEEINALATALEVLCTVEKEAKPKDQGICWIVDSTRLFLWFEDAIELFKTIKIKKSIIALFQGAFSISDGIVEYSKFTRQIQHFKNILAGLIKKAENNPEEIFISTKIQKKDINKAANSLDGNVDGKKVFIIHGHDELNRLRLEKMLKDRFELEVVIMKEKPKKGRTLIDKFEQEAKQVGYAFALFTPDDFTKTDKEDYYAARPNVIFELGWFYSHLGREKVAILLKEDTKIPSDLEGIERFQFKESVDEKFHEIQIELQEAGLIAAVKIKES